MPTEFQTLIMRAKACYVCPRTGDVTLTLEQRGCAADVCSTVTRAVVEKREVQVVVDSEVKP